MVVQVPSVSRNGTRTMQQNGNGHRRCFSASFANIYDVFRCKQLQPEAVALSARNLVSSRAFGRHLQTKEEVAGEARKMIDSSSGRPKSSRIGVRKDDHVHVDDRLPHRAHEQQQQRMDSAEAEVTARKMRAVAEMQAMVRGLQSGDPERQAAAAADIRLAARRDGEARTTLAMMGAIPPLVGMLDSSSPAQHSSALLALLNLAVRNDQNKGAIVLAGAVPRIIRLLQQQQQQQGGAADPVRESAAAALLSLSALDANKGAIGALGALEPLVRLINDRGSVGVSGSSQARKDAMGALYNLSICPANAPPMVDAGAVPALLAAVYESELSGRAVATAGNMVATPAGRRAMASVPGSALVFVDVLASFSWGRCGCPSPSRSQQERAAYVVMVMAEYSPAQRRAMSRAGAASALLELVLVGSTVAQERASRALECLRATTDDDGNDGSYLLEDEDEQHRQQVEKEMVSEERRAVNRMVQQSLRLNMQRITRRACLPSLAVARTDRNLQLAITATPSSRSLPY